MLGCCYRLLKLAVLLLLIKTIKSKLNEAEMKYKY